MLILSQNEEKFTVKMMSMLGMIYSLESLWYNLLY